MKKVILLCLIVASGFFAKSQEFDTPSEGKSLIYFVRSSGTGALINFKYFDGEKYLGKLNGMHYFKYECEPGEHIFWAAAENRDFIKGELKPNSTYIIEVRPTMGAFKAAVRLHPVSSDSEKFLKKARKLISKKDPAELKDQDEDHAFFIENGMERYDDLNAKGEVKQIDSEATFN